MSEGATAYLVVRRDDGFGDVYPLTPGQTCSLGRAASNRIVLKDDLCSREHAEVTFGDGRWRVRDLNSLNGTRLNGVAVEGDRELAVHDEIQVGRTNFLFVEDMSQLPELPRLEDRPEGVSIKVKPPRPDPSSFLTPDMPALAAADGAADATVGPPPRHALSRDLSLLYRLALDMASALTYDELCRIVLDALLEAVPAEVGAILTTIPDGSGDGVTTEPAGGKSQRGAELEVTAHRHRDPSIRSYTRVSEYVSNEVLAGREAILAEDVARDRHLRNRESLSELGATSLICAPVIHADRVLGLIHLYCTDPHKALDAEDLEFAVAVAKQLGNAVHQLRVQQSLSAENRSLRDQLRVESELVGASQAIREVESQIGRVAGTNACCLIRGESGSGKELVARAVHYSSPRRDGPFVCLNCAAAGGDAAGKRVVRPRSRDALFTGATEEERRGQIRGGPPRHDLPGRDRRDGGGRRRPSVMCVVEGQTFERARRRADLAGRACRRRRTRPAGWRRPWPVPPRPVLPFAGGGDPRAAAAGEPQERRAAAGGAFPAAVRARDRPAHTRLHAGSAGEDAGVPLAGQRARAAQRGGTGGGRWAWGRVLDVE